MNTSMKALVISLAFHGAFLSLVYALSGGFVQPSKPIRIDFTLNEPGPGPASPKPPGPVGPNAPQKAAQDSPSNVPAKHATNRPRIAPSKPASRPAAHLAPATEQAGLVPIVTAHRETLPLPGASNSNEGGTETGGGQGSATTGSVGGGDGTGGGGSGGEGGVGTEQLRNCYRREHFEYIRKIIQGHIVYPPRARRFGWQGRVVVMFCVMQSGNVKDIRIRNSSGYDILDENVIETIRKVEPFTKPPVAVELIIPIEYRLYK